MSISTILPSLTVKPPTANGSPRANTTNPGAPFTRTGRVNQVGPEKVTACPATAAAPRTTLDRPGRTAPASARSTTSGSRTASSPSKSPVRAAARKASTTSRWRLRSGRGQEWLPVSGAGRGWPAALQASETARRWERYRRMARRIRRGARRPAARRGSSVSSTTSSARPTESARSASCSGSVPSGGLTTGSGTRTSRGSSRFDLRDCSRFRQTRATIVVSDPPTFSTSSAPARLARARPPERRRPPRSASPASGRRRSAGGAGPPQTAQPAIRVESPVTFLSRILSYE